MICSFIPGRVRIRTPRFKDPDLASTAATLLREQPCVRKVTANPETGSLLIEYDPEKLDMEAALKVLEQIDPEGLEWFLAQNQVTAEEGCDGLPEDFLDEVGDCGCFSMSNKEAVEYAAMVGAFVVCTGSAFLRSKGLHLYSGLSLAGLTLNHIYKYRRSLLARFRSLTQK